jgi:hypothetical protein
VTKTAILPSKAGQRGLQSSHLLLDSHTYMSPVATSDVLLVVVKPNVGDTTRTPTLQLSCLPLTTMDVVNAVLNAPNADPITVTRTSHALRIIRRTLAIYG